MSYDFLSFFIAWMMAHAQSCAPIPHPEIRIEELRSPCKMQPCNPMVYTRATAFSEGQKYQVLLIERRYGNDKSMVTVQYMKNDKRAYDAPSIWLFTQDNRRDPRVRPDWCDMPVLEGFDP